MKYPITCILGQRGAGKTLFMTYLAHKYHSEGKRIFSNFTLKDIPFDYISFEQLAKLPDELTNAIVFLDEIQIGADSYEIFKKSNKMITIFTTQLRKRKITLYYSTQVFGMVTKRMRLQTNYIIEMSNKVKPGYIDANIYEYNTANYQDYIKSIKMDLRGYFNSYDTDEVITFSENEISEGVNKYDA
jgi:GTPase SAR1 family protein